MSTEQYKKKYGAYKEIYIDDNTFAAACYNQNSIEELIEALSEHADRIDCNVWKLSPSQWREGIQLALMAKINDLKAELYPKEE